MFKSMFFRRPLSPSVPEGVRVYAIGDIHGRADLLDIMHERIVSDADGTSLNKILIYLGDYVDRGPDSKGVLTRLAHGTPPGFEVYRIKGNHDAALLMFLNDPNFYRVWRGFGAGETLRSYGVKPPMFEDPNDYRIARDELAKAMPREHRSMLQNLPLHVVIGDYLFVHAGIRPGRTLQDQSEEDLTSIRDGFMDFRGNLGHVVVHGHTPLDQPEHWPNRISVDTGAYATGILTAVVLEGTDHRFLQASTC